MFIEELFYITQVLARVLLELSHQALHQSTERYHKSVLGTLLRAGWDSFLTWTWQVPWTDYIHIGTSLGEF